jgi:hypothetical protein
LKLFETCFSFKACYNCNQTEHTTRDCPEPRKDRNGGGGGGGRGFDSGGNRGAFNSGGGDRGNTFGRTSSTSGTFRNSRNPNGDDQDDNGNAKSSFSVWRGGAGNEVTNSTDSEYSGRSSTFKNSGTRGSFNSGGGRFRGRTAFI